MLTSLKFLFFPGKTFKSDLILDFRKKLYFRLQALMFAYHLFHPYHIIPTVKLIAASVELSHTLITKMFMKIHTGIGQVFIFF